MMKPAIACCRRLSPFQSAIKSYDRSGPVKRRHNLRNAAISGWPEAPEGGAPAMRVRDFSRPTTLNPDRLFGQVAQKLAVAVITGRVRAGGADRGAD